MKINNTISMLLVMLLAVPTSADYSIDWYTIDSGGGTSSGGPYQLTGTIGQPDAGYHDAAPYELLGGFLVGGPLCIVDLEDFARFAGYWLETTCDAGNDYCDGADLNQEDGVNIEDMKILANEWLDVCPFGWPL